MFQLRFDDLFEVTDAKVTQGKNSFFKHHLKAKKYTKSLNGAGVYFIFKQDQCFVRLIYVGRHNTKVDFHRDRVLKHLRTLTFKFNHALSLGIDGNKAKNLAELKRTFEKRFSFPGCRENELWLNAKRNLLHLPHRINGNLPEEGSFLRDQTKGVMSSGDETSPRRFQYACAFWSELKDIGSAASLQTYLNDNYLLAWAELSDGNKAKEAEKRLINKRLPVVNKEMQNQRPERSVAEMLALDEGSNVWRRSTPFDEILGEIRTDL